MSWLQLTAILCFQRARLNGTNSPPFPVPLSRDPSRVAMCSSRTSERRPPDGCDPVHVCLCDFQGTRFRDARHLAAEGTPPHSCCCGAVSQPPRIATHARAQHPFICVSTLSRRGNRLGRRRRRILRHAAVNTKLLLSVSRF